VRDAQTDAPSSPPALPDPDPPFAEDVPERRAAARRPGRARVRAEVRLGKLGMGPDLGMALVDLSVAGARVRLKAGVRPGDEVEVGLWPAGQARAVRGQAVVRWCRPDREGAFAAGVQFRRKLDVLTLADFAE
jgi:PilZ domain